MGNCIVVEEKPIRVMKTDGKILEYKAPTKVSQVLIDYSGYAISDSVPDMGYLNPDVKLLGGCLYYMVPKTKTQSKERKKVRFADTVEEEKDQEKEEEEKDGVLRIKLVISKKELEEMLNEEGDMVHDLVSRILSKQSMNQIDTTDDCRGWQPVLESIPEVN